MMMTMPFLGAHNAQTSFNGLCSNATYARSNALSPRRRRQHGATNTTEHGGAVDNSHSREAE